MHLPPATRRRFLVTAGALGGASLLPRAMAADWVPNRPINLMISFPPGGTADWLGRVLTHRLTERKKWATIVENRPGGGGVILRSLLKTARPDGYTLGLCASYELTYTPLESGAARFDIDDFTYIAGLSRSPHCLVARPDAGLDSFDKIRAYARKKGFVSVGTAAPFDWMAERFGADLGITAVGVPFKGGAEMMQQVMASQLDLAWSAGSHVPLERGGKLKVVVALTQDRLPANPDVQSLHEIGGKLVVESRFLIFGPKSLPRDTNAALTQAIAEVVNDPAMQAEVIDRSLLPSFLEGPQLRESIHAEAAQAKAITAAALGKK